MTTRTTTVTHEGKTYTIKTQDIGRSTKQEVKMSGAKEDSISRLTEDEIDKLYKIADYILYGDGTGMDKGLFSYSYTVKKETVWIDKFEGVNRKGRRSMKAKK